MKLNELIWRLEGVESDPKQRVVLVDPDGKLYDLTQVGGHNGLEVRLHIQERTES